MESSPIDLSPRETYLLEVLLRRREQLLWREEILSALFEAAVPASTDVVDVLIRSFARIGEGRIEAPVDGSFRPR